MRSLRASLQDAQQKGQIERVLGCVAFMRHFILMPADTHTVVMGTLKRQGVKQQDFLLISELYAVAILLVHFPLAQSF